MGVVETHWRQESSIDLGHLTQQTRSGLFAEGNIHRQFVLRISLYTSPSTSSPTSELRPPAHHFHRFIGGFRPKARTVPRTWRSFVASFCRIPQELLLQPRHREVGFEKVRCKHAGNVTQIVLLRCCKSML